MSDDIGLNQANARWQWAQEALSEASAQMRNHYPAHEAFVLEQLLYTIAVCGIDAMAERYRSRGLEWDPRAPSLCWRRKAPEGT